MKNLVIVLFLVFSFSSYAQTEVSSTINSVKVYRQNAEITRKAATKLSAGKQFLVLTGISTNIDPSSLQVQIESAGNTTLLSAKYERNFLLPKKNNPNIEKLKAKLDLLNDEIYWIKDQRIVLKGMEEVLNKNQDLGGNNVGFTPSQVIELSNAYKTKFLEIRKELIALTKQEKSILEKSTTIQNQLNELNASFNRPSGSIVLQLSSNASTHAKFKCTYTVSNAGWSPIYDLRSEGISKNVQLNYKANVYQNTGNDWSSINLIISTGNPSQNNDRPILSPLYAAIYSPHVYDEVVVTGYSRKKNKSSVRNMALEEVVVVEDDKKEAYKDGFNYNAQVSENQINVEFTIAQKQTITSDNKENLMPLDSYELNTKYVYHTVPKLDQGAFLIAKISDWGKFNLISGEANIFFEGAYVGKSHINSNVTSDDLLISMGRDHGIVVERKAIKEFTASKLIGTNTKETFGYAIVVKNKKSIPIEIEILDQISVSQDKAIKVELEEKGAATYTEKIGKLIWKLQIQPGQSKKEKFIYSVKYPKKETITGKK